MIAVEVLQLRLAGVVGTVGGNELKEDHLEDDLEDEDDDDKQLDADTTKLKKQQKPTSSKREHGICYYSFCGVFYVCL